jgi:hypothetical protein
MERELNISDDEASALAASPTIGWPLTSTKHPAKFGC